MENFAERLFYFIDNHLDTSVRNFEKKIQVSYSSIDKAIKQGTNIGLDKVIKIAKAYPELNIDWLLTGEGEMIESPNKNGNNSNALNIIEKLSDSIQLMTEAGLANSKSIQALTESELLRANNESRLITILEKTSA